MESYTLISPCPVCQKTPLLKKGAVYRCVTCLLTVEQQTQFGFRKKDAYRVLNLHDDYALAKKGILHQTFTLSELKLFFEQIYPDDVFEAFGHGHYDALRMPQRVVAQVIVEQLREESQMQVNGFQYAKGMALTESTDYQPKGTTPTDLTWEQQGNIYLTNVRLIFLSNTFTFIRLDRKVTAMHVFENGIALQRRGEDFAHYFMGCRYDQAALIGAFIQGKIPALRLK